MPLVRFGLQLVRQRFPAPHQVANAKGFFGMPGDDLAQRLHLVAQETKRLLWLNRCHRHLLVFCERMSRQNYAVIGHLIGGHRQILNLNLGDVQMEQSP